MPTYKDLIFGNPQLGLPRGLIPRLQAAAHGWQRRGGAEPADVASMPLSRDPTLAEIAAQGKYEAQKDADERPNLMELLLNTVAGPGGPGKAMFLGAKALHANTPAIAKAMKRWSAGEDQKKVWEETGIFRGAEGMPRWEISDQMARFRLPTGEGYRPVTGRLGDLLKHPELFANYPELENFQLSLIQGPKHGSFSPKNNSIEITGENYEDAMHTLMHEIQHGVQKLEGHTQGGSESIAKELAELRATDSARKMKDLRETLKRLGLNHQIPDLVNQPKYRKLQQDYDDATQTGVGRKWYPRIAGEVEANNTMRRWLMDMEARRRAYPVETEQFPRELQILRNRPINPFF